MKALLHSITRYNRGEIATTLTVLAIVVMTVGAIAGAQLTKQEIDTRSSAYECAQVSNVRVEPSGTLSAGQAITCRATTNQPGSYNIACGWRFENEWPQNGGRWVGATCNGSECSFGIAMDSTIRDGSYSLWAYDMSSECGPSTGSSIPLSVDNPVENTPAPISTPIPINTPTPEPETGSCGANNNGYCVTFAGCSKDHIRTDNKQGCSRLATACCEPRISLPTATPTVAKGPRSTPTPIPKSPRSTPTLIPTATPIKSPGVAATPTPIKSPGVFSTPTPVLIFCTAEYDDVQRSGWCVEDSRDCESSGRKIGNDVWDSCTNGLCCATPPRVTQPTPIPTTNPVIRSTPTPRQGIFLRRQTPTPTPDRVTLPPVGIEKLSALVINGSFVIHTDATSAQSEEIFYVDGKSIQKDNIRSAYYIVE